MSYNRANTINAFVTAIANGEMQFSDVRKKLEQYDLEEGEVTVVVRQVDNEIQRKALIKSKNESGQSLFLLGLVLCVLGLVTTIGTYTGLIDLGNYYVIAFGPILGGLGLVVKGRVEMKRK